MRFIPHRILLNHFRQAILMTAPIVLFVFARPEHTRRTLESLAANPLAEQSDLIIYADAARNPEEEAKVNEVRTLVRNISCFRSVSIIERETNYGLARNIIEGVTAVCNEYGRVIVLEDDIVTSPYFLTFMNNALDKYAGEKKVWHISGWNYPITKEGLDDIFFWKIMDCWGWATWKDRWDFYERNIDIILKKFDNSMIKEFDLDNSGLFWSQIIDNKNSIIETWAIFWYASIFFNNGLCLNPTVSYVDNIGLDGSGVHCGNNDYLKISLLNRKEKINFPKEVNESFIATQRIKKYHRKHRKSFIIRIINKLYNIIITPE